MNIAKEETLFDPPGEKVREFVRYRGRRDKRSVDDPPREKKFVMVAEEKSVIERKFVGLRRIKINYHFFERKFERIAEEEKLFIILEGKVCKGC